MGARADRLNRVLLTLLGLVLLGAGAAGLVFGTGLAGERFSRRRVLSDDVVAFVTDQAPWLWPVAALVAVLLALLALRWLARQLTSDRVGRLDLTERRSDGETTVDTAALTGALTDAVEQCPGVEGASARLVRVRGHDTLLLKVRLSDRADLARTRTALAEPLQQLRRVLGDGLYPLVRVELEPTTKGSGRALV